MTKALWRVVGSFAVIEMDTPHECEFCGARAPAGQRFCDEHEAEFATRH